MSVELARERLVAVLPPDHHLAGRKRVRLADLADSPCVDFPYGSLGRAQTYQAFAAAGVVRDVAFEVTDTPLMAAVIRHGLAIGFLADAYVEVAPELAGLVTVRIQDAPRRVEYVAWASPGPSPAAAQLLAILGIDADG